MSLPGRSRHTCATLSKLDSSVDELMLVENFR
jgi:hypothetical protein